MRNRHSQWVGKYLIGSLTILLGAAGWVLFSNGPDRLGRSGQTALRIPTGSPQLISVEPYPVMEGAACEWVPASASTSLMASLQPTQAAQAAGPASREEAAKREPLRVIRDSYASFSSVAVDPIHNEVVVTDENMFQILVYDRLANTPPNATMTEPKRMIGGEHTKIEFQCGLYIDPSTGDIYAVNNDTVDTLVIFSRDAKGNVPPTRELYTPHGTFGIAVDEEKQEMFLTVQHSNAVVVYPKTAKEDDSPIRLLQGNRTGLNDPHGISVDTKNGLMYITNHGSVRDVAASGGEVGYSTWEGEENWPSRQTIPGSGRNLGSSISVYPMDAQGDTPPLWVIKGPNTQLNWPAGIAADPEREELYVANDAGDSILVFSADARGDAAPIRTLKGPRSGIKNPTGLFLDKKNDELWVSNFGNHTATVYKPTASGDTPPLRTIRSGPLGEPSLMIGNPGSVAYDTKREEILVPN